MTPQIEILLVPSASDPAQWFPVAASLAGFPWGTEERSLGIVANCPDVIDGVDVDALLAQLTAEDAPVQVQFPFQPDPAMVTTAGAGQKTQSGQTQGGATQTGAGRVQTPASSWMVDVSILDAGFLQSDPEKPVLPADAVSSALVVPPLLVVPPAQVVSI